MSTSEEIRLKIAAYIQAFNARDIDAVAAIYAEDATLEDPVGSEVKHGREEIRAFYEQYRDQPSFLQLTGDFRFPEGGVAFSFYCYMGDPAAPMIVEVTDTFRFDENGQVKEMRAFWGMPNVLGVNTRPPSAGLQQPLAGQVVLLAGSGARALACCHAVAAGGGTVIVAAPAREAEAIAAQVRDAGARAIALPGTSGETADLLAQARALRGRLDAFVDLAGDHSASVGADLPARTITIAGPRNTPDGRPAGTAQEVGDRILAPDSVPAEMVAETVRWLCAPMAGTPRSPVTVDLSAA